MRYESGGIPKVFEWTTDPTSNTIRTYGFGMPSNNLRIHNQSAAEMYVAFGADAPASITAEGWIQIIGGEVLELPIQAGKVHAFSLGVSQPFQVTVLQRRG